MRKSSAISDEKTRAVGNEIAGLVAAPFVGAGIVMVLAAIGTAAAVILSLIGNIPTAVQGDWNCRGIPRESAAWVECMADYQPTGDAGTFIRSLTGDFQ